MHMQLCLTVATPDHAHKFQHSTGTPIPTCRLYKQGTYKMSCSPVCIFFLQPPTLAIYNCYTLLQVVAMSLLVAVNKSSVQSMKFTRYSFQPSMFSRVTVVVLHMLCGNIIFIIMSCPVPPRLVHGMLWHWLDLQRGWLWISYFVDLRTEMSCVWSVCWGSLRVPPGLSSCNYILTLLEGWNRRNLDPYFHQLTTLRVVIRTYEELVGSKAIQ